MMTTPSPLADIASRRVTDVADRLKKADRWTWAIGLGVACAVAPFVFLAIQGMLGLAVAGVIGLVGIHGAPVLAQRLSHGQLGALTRGARRNPLLSLEKQLIDRREALAAAARQLQLALARIDHFVEQAHEQARREPASGDRWRSRIEQAQALRGRKLAALQQASAAVEAFGQAVERARVEWAIVEAEQAMNQALGQATGQALEQLLERSALDSVREQMNRAFAGLETELALQAGQAASSPLTAPDSDEPRAIPGGALRGLAQTPGGHGIRRST